MPFLNVDDNFTEHGKVYALSDGAFRLHVSGLCHCARLMTDGYVIAEKVPNLMPKFKRSYLTELLATPLWHPVDGGYEIHDYLDWNRSREQIESQREKKRAAGRKGAQVKWSK